MSNNMPKLKLNLKNKFIADKAKKVVFIDIETSLVTAKIFRTGTQYVTANQLTDRTKILTVAGGSLYDMMTKGEAGVWSCSNHRSSTFKQDPLDDSEILATVWDILDGADVIVAHNAAFDKGHLFGRFLELGWKLPSPFKVLCTYRYLDKFKLTSKKLEELSSSLNNTHKIGTSMSLWQRCDRGEIKAFKEMEKYNIGDIYDTMYKLFVRTAYYNPAKSIDFSDHENTRPQCRVDGTYLKEDGIYINYTTGNEYTKYINKKTGIYYRNKYTTTSKKNVLGYVVPIA